MLLIKLKKALFRPGKRFRMDSFQQGLFTMLELLVAMAVLLILMSFLTQFLFSAQQVWKLTGGNTRINENARIIFELMGKDLQCALSDRADNREIPFYIFETDSTSPYYPENGRILCFVSATDQDSDANSRLCEIIYAHVDSGDHRYEFRRQRVSQGDDKWDFYGAPISISSPYDPANADNWFYNARSGGGLRKVIGGVESISVSCYHPNPPVPVHPPSTPNLTDNLYDPGTYFELPHAVRISLTLFNPKLTSVWNDFPDEKRKSLQHNFSRILFLK